MKNIKNTELLKYLKYVTQISKSVAASGAFSKRQAAAEHSMAAGRHRSVVDYITGHRHIVALYTSIPLYLSSDRGTAHCLTKILHI